MSSLMAIMGVISVMISGFGYFAMQGVADALGLDGGLLWSTPSDVFHYAFLGLMGVSSFLPGEPMAPLWRLLSQPISWLMAIQVSVLVWVLITTDRSPQAIAKRRQDWLDSLALRWLQRPVAKRPLYQWLSVVLSVLIFPAVMVAMWLGVLMFLGGLFMTVLFGMASGHGYVSSVLSLPVCEAGSSAAPAPSTGTGRCVTVQWRDSGQVLEKTGQLLTATSSYVLLRETHLQPHRVVRIPVSSSTLVTTVQNI